MGKCPIGMFIAATNSTGKTFINTVLIPCSFGTRREYVGVGCGRRGHVRRALRSCRAFPRPGRGGHARSRQRLRRQRRPHVARPLREGGGLPRQDGRPLWPGSGGQALLRERTGVLRAQRDSVMPAPRASGAPRARRELAWAFMGEAPLCRSGDGQAAPRRNPPRRHACDAGKRAQQSLPIPWTCFSGSGSGRLCC